MSYFGTLAVYAGKEVPIIAVLLNLFALAVHLGEAVYAAWLCTRLNLNRACKFKWLIQTFILGYPSLRILCQKANSNRAKRRS